MAQLTGNAIQSSYLGLLKTDDNAAMQNAGFPQITDGAGNNSMLKMSQTELQLGSNINTQYFKQYANSGGITEIKDAALSIYDATASQYVILDATNAGVGSGSNYFLATAAGSSIAGPLDLSGATVTGLPSSGADASSSVYNMNEFSTNFAGYASQYLYKTMQPVVGRPNIGGEVLDANDTKTIFTRMYGIKGNVVTTISVPLLAGSACDFTLELYRCDATTGLPGERVHHETTAEATGNAGFYDVTLTTPFTFTDDAKNELWVGLRTTNSRKGTRFNPDNLISNFGYFGFGGGDPGNTGMSPFNAMYYTSSEPGNVVPATIPSNYAWSVREEMVVLLWK